MAREPGWYDDPEGLPGVYRWWDGATWTVDVTTVANAAAPGGEPAATHPNPTAPTPPVEERTGEVPAPDAATQQQDGRSPIGWTTGRRLVARLVVLTVMIGVLVSAVTLLRPLLDLPDTDDVEVPDLSDLERGPGPDGRYAGGGLSYDAIQGSWTRTLLVSNVPMDDLDGEETVVATPAKGNPQYAYVWLGTVDPELVVDGDLEATADRFADRFVARGYPADARLDDEATEPMTLDGTDAVRLTRAYAYRVRGTPITGEDLVVVVADTGEVPSVLVASVPDGFPAVRSQTRRAIASLRAG